MGCTSGKPKRTTSIDDVTAAQKEPTAPKNKEPVLQSDKNGQINKPTPEKGQGKVKPAQVGSNGSSNDVSNAIQIPGAHRSFLAPDGIPFIDEDVESEVEERVVIQPAKDSHSKAPQPDQNKNVVVSVHKDVKTPPLQQQQQVGATHSSALPANSQQPISTGRKNEVDLRVDPSRDGGHATVQSGISVKQVTPVVSTEVNPNTDVGKSQSANLKISEAEAATKIQAGIRGFLDRQKVKAIKAEKEHPSSSPAGAKDDQHEQKGKIKLHREEHIEDEVDSSPHHVHLDESTAATKIQASYKGYKTRKQLKIEKK